MWNLIFYSLPTTVLTETLFPHHHITLPGTYLFSSYRFSIYNPAHTPHCQVIFFKPRRVHVCPAQQPVMALCLPTHQSPLLLQTKNFPLVLPYSFFFYIHYSFTRALPTGFSRFLAHMIGKHIWVSSFTCFFLAHKTSFYSSLQWYYLDGCPTAGVGNFFYKKSGSKYFSCCSPCSPCCSHSTLLHRESYHRTIHKWKLYPWSKKTLFSQTGGGSDLACEPVCPPQPYNIKTNPYSHLIILFPCIFLRMVWKSQLCLIKHKWSPLVTYKKNSETIFNI